MLSKRLLNWATNELKDNETTSSLMYKVQILFQRKAKFPEQEGWSYYRRRCAISKKMCEKIPLLL